MPHDTTKLLHDIKSRCASLGSAAGLYKDCSAGEKKEMLALMTAAAEEINKTVAALSKAS
jgi:hypothetical protein